MVLGFGDRASRLSRWMRNAASPLALTVGLIASGALSLAQAQEIPPPRSMLVDANGVDLLSGDVSFSSGLNSIGPKGDSMLSSSFVRRAVGQSVFSLEGYIRIADDPTWQDPVTGETHTQYSPQKTTLVLAGRSFSFSGAAGTEATLAEDDGSGTFAQGATTASGIVYTAPDGTRAVFQYAVHTPGHFLPAAGYLQSITYPTGEVLTYTRTGTKLKVESSLGYVLISDYGTVTSFYGANSIAANLAQGNCDATSCGGPTFAGQDTLGRITQVATPNGTGGTSYILTATSPSGAVTTYTISTTPYGFRVASVSRSGSTWTYAYSLAKDSQDPDPVDGILTTTVTAPNNVQRIIKSRLSTSQVISDQEGATNGAGGRTSTYAYTQDSPTFKGFGKLQKVTKPEGDSYEYAYDAYNNIISRKHNPKSGSSLVTTEVLASYSCRTITTPTTTICNKPDWTRDENGNQTDYTYYPANGLVETVTLPAGPNGVRPQTRYFYTQVSATYIKDGAVVSGAPAWRLLSTSACRTSASCAGTADELVTEYAYESGTSVYHNARLISVTTRAGNATASSGPYSRTTFAYNARGDMIETDGPLTGNGDLVQTRYDASRWVVGTVGQAVTIDGATKYRASKVTYRADGQVQMVQTGVVADRTDATFTSNFLTHSSVATDHDSYGRPVAQESRNASDTAYALTQTNYDSLGRVNCVAQRMSAFTSRPGACSVSTTSPDPDRITQNTYNDYNEITAIQSGLGVEPFYDRRATYTANGKVETEKDGEGNVTTYAYDGLDRLKRVTYPSTAKGSGNSNSGDFEEYGYDNAGNVTSRILRGGNAIASTYDNLGRLRTRATPSADLAGASYIYTYDNFGNLTAVTDGSRTSSQNYDALSRMLWQQDDTLGVASRVSYEYDAAGRRTKLTWPDSFFVAYDYDNAGALTAVRRAGSAAATDRIAAFTYDELGRRKSANRGDNKVSTAYAYNPTNLLMQSLTHTPTSAGDSVQYGFTYNATGQVRQRTISNASYAWNGAYVVDRPYGTDGLNRINSAGPPPVAPATSAAGYTTYDYDPRGNLKCMGARSDLPACSSPTTTYSYDSENRLRGVGASSSLVYDPVGRLLQSTISGTTTRYLYDGVNLIGEYAGASATPLRRYVFGDSADEVLVRYNVSSPTPDAPRWLLADHQGSIVAETNENGAVTAKLTYDEYGVPGPGNAGLFQYTGQIYLSGPDLYHYKARAYSPTLGRFLQTDPISYDDGLNWYAYVGNDPVNGTDPSGLQMVTVEHIVVSGCGPSCQWTAMEKLKADLRDLFSRSTTQKQRSRSTSKRPEDSKACEISRTYAQAAAEAQLAANTLQIAGLGVAGYGLTANGKGLRPLTRGMAKAFEFYSIAPELGGFINSAISGTAAAYATGDAGAIGSTVTKFFVTQASAAKFEGQVAMTNSALRLAVGEGADRAVDVLTPNGCKKK